MWNQLELEPPPCVHLPYKAKENRDVLVRCRATLASAVEWSNSAPTLQLLLQESAILNRLIYKANSQFRRHAFLRSFKKTNTCLKKWQKASLLSPLEELLKSWPSDVILLARNNDVYAPSRQMIQYALIRLQGAVRLMQQTCLCSVRSMTDILDMLQLGLHIPQMLVFAATTARIWSTCQAAKKQMNDIYNNLYSELSLIAATPVPWLPDDTSLPSDLDSLLQSDDTSTLSALSTNEESDTNLPQTAVQDIVTDRNSPVHIVEDVGVALVRPNISEDVGVAIVRPKIAEDLGVAIERPKITKDSVVPLQKTVEIKTVNVESVNDETVNVKTVNVETINVETVNVETVNVETVNVGTVNVETVTMPITKATDVIEDISIAELQHSTICSVAKPVSTKEVSSNDTPDDTSETVDGISLRRTLSIETLSSSSDIDMADDEESSADTNNVIDLIIDSSSDGPCASLVNVIDGMGLDSSGVSKLHTSSFGLSSTSQIVSSTDMFSLHANESPINIDSDDDDDEDDSKCMTNSPLTESQDAVAESDVFNIESSDSDSDVEIIMEVPKPDIESPDAPKLDVKNLDVPKSDVENLEFKFEFNPDVSEPDVENLDVSEPDVENLDVSEPDVENLDVSEPDVENLDVSEPDVENLDVENNQEIISVNPSVRPPNYGPEMTLSQTLAVQYAHPEVPWLIPAHILVDSMKNSIGLLHEISRPMKWHVKFVQIGTSGPPHLRVFTTQLCVLRGNKGNLTVNGQGHSKKQSRQKAAEDMLVKIQHDECNEFEKRKSNNSSKPECSGQKRKVDSREECNTDEISCDNIDDVISITDSENCSAANIDTSKKKQKVTEKQRKPMAVSRLKRKLLRSTTPLERNAVISGVLEHMSDEARVIAEQSVSAIDITDVQDYVHYKKHAMRVIKIYHLDRLVQKTLQADITTADINSDELFLNVQQAVDKTAGTSTQHLKHLEWLDEDLQKGVFRCKHRYNIPSGHATCCLDILGNIKKQNHAKGAYIVFLRMLLVKVLCEAVILNKEKNIEISRIPRDITESMIDNVSLINKDLKKVLLNTKKAYSVYNSLEESTFKTKLKIHIKRLTELKIMKKQAKKDGDLSKWTNASKKVQKSVEMLIPELNVIMSTSVTNFTNDEDSTDSTNNSDGVNSECKKILFSLNKTRSLYESLEESTLKTKLEKHIELLKKKRRKVKQAQKEQRTLSQGDKARKEVKKSTQQIMPALQLFMEASGPTKTCKESQTSSRPIVSDATDSNTVTVNQIQANKGSHVNTKCKQHKKNVGTKVKKTKVLDLPPSRVLKVKNAKTSGNAKRLKTAVQKSSVWIIT